MNSTGTLFKGKGGDKNVSIASLMLRVMTFRRRHKIMKILPLRGPESTFRSKSSLEMLWNKLHLVQCWSAYFRPSDPQWNSK